MLSGCHRGCRFRVAKESYLDLAPNLTVLNPGAGIIDAAMV